MDSTRKSAVLAGILFLVADLAGIPSLLLSASLVNSSDWLSVLAAGGFQIELAAMLIIVMATACAGIAFALFPVLRKNSPGLAVSAVGFRVIEAAFELVTAVILLLLLSLSREFVGSGSPGESPYHAIGGLLRAANDCIGNVIIPMLWCLGALMYSLVFYQARLLPRWLAIWGLVVYPLLIIQSLMVLFEVVVPQDTISVALVFPAALQEFVLALWLVARGFAASSPARFTAPLDAEGMQAA